MQKYNLKSFATSATTWIFVVISISGVMMFFHFFDAYVKHLHEILGIAFVGAASVHIYANWRSMKAYFSQKLFLYSFAVVAIVSFMLALASTQEGPNPKKVLIEAMLKAPLQNTLVVLSQDMQIAQTNLTQNGIKFSNDQSLAQIAKENQTSAFHIIEVIMKK
jgi:hypothetical protein